VKDGEDDSLVVLDPARVKQRRPGVGPTYTQSLAAEVCETIGASDLSIESLCRQHADRWPTVKTLYEWRYRHRAFDEAFAQAEAMRASRFMHQCVEIADDDSRDLIESDGKSFGNNTAVTRDRLRIETRLKTAARFDPQRFGDRVEQNIRVGFIPLDEAIHQLK
jgi:hypothetical protein